MLVKSQWRFSCWQSQSGAFLVGEVTMDLFLLVKSQWNAVEPLLSVKSEWSFCW